MEHLIQQLRNPDPTIRRNTIIGIGKRGDPRALKALKYVHQNDPDPQLRELAYKAGAHIAKRQTSQQQATPPPPPPPQEPQSGFAWHGELFEDDLKKKPEETARIEVSKQDEERAKVLLSRAMDYFMRGDRAKAAENLAKAVERNPNLRKDPMANGLVQDITGIKGGHAFDAILNSGSRKSMFAADRQLKTQQKLAETADDLMTVLVYLAGYFVLITAGVSIYLIIQFRYALENVDTTLDLNPYRYEDIGIITLIVVGVIYAIFNTFAMVGFGGAVHIVARWVLIGSGTMLGFLKKQIPFVATAMAISFAVVSIFALSPDPTTGISLLFFNIFGILIFLYLFAGLVARYYNLGTIGGCVATVLGIILFGITNLAIIFILGASVE